MFDSIHMRPSVGFPSWHATERKLVFIIFFTLRRITI
jgi:hypothetical protein